MTTNEEIKRKYQDEKKGKYYSFNTPSVIEDMLDEARADERIKTFEKCITEVEKLRIVDRLTTHSIEYNEIIDEVKARLEEFQKQEVL
jgi:hypothetical protein